jgi:hypothetical protein
MRCALVLIAACGSGAVPPSEPAQPAADSAPCHEVAAHELTVMNIGFLPAAKTDAMRVAIETHCHDDRWTLDARRCVVTATGFDDMSACLDKLTPAQRTAYQRELGSDAQIEPNPQQQAPPELLK